MTDRLLDLKVIREELEAEIEAHGWAFWSLTIQAALISDEYNVKLVKAGGTPKEI